MSKWTRQKSCGAREVQLFLENASKNAVYIHWGAVVNSFKALRTWVEESVLKSLQKASFFSVMGDKCTDITTVEELSIFCHWAENGTLLNASWKYIYSSCQVSQRQKLSGWQCCRNGVYGAATFSGKKTGVQARLKKNILHMHYLFTVIVTCCS